MLSGWARDLVAAPSSNFDKAFDHAFEQHLVCLWIDICTSLLSTMNTSLVNLSALSLFDSVV